MMKLRTARPLVCAAAAAALVLGVMAPMSAAAAPKVSIEVLSGRADSVSGGDALVAVTGAKKDSMITAAGVDVTDAFAPRGDRLVGLVDGLPLGTARSRCGRRTARRTPRSR